MNRVLARTSRAVAAAVAAALTVAFLVAAPAQADDDVLNGHVVVHDSSGRLVSWAGSPDRAYGRVSSLAWTYLVTKVPKADENGRPAYLSHSYLDSSTQLPVTWPHNPAGLYSMLTESALRYYQYSGDARVLAAARTAVDAELAHGLTTPTDSWRSVPYASGNSGSLAYRGAAVGDIEGPAYGSGDGVGVIEPDKVGEYGFALVQMYELTGDKKYLVAAVRCADALVGHLRTGLSATRSPWPFRVSARTNAVREDYGSNVTGALTLFDRLVALHAGSSTAYARTSATVLAWTLRYPLVNGYWQGYFEDVEEHQEIGSNLNQYNAMMFARYLLLNPGKDKAWRAHVDYLLRWVRREFGQTSDDGTTQIREQDAFDFRMGSHTARYASVNALLYEKTGDRAAREEAYRSFDWATYMARPDGVVIDGPEVNNQWFTDGYGDYVRHFMIGMGAMPEYAPNGQTHLLESTSLVRAVAYGSSLRYTAFDRSGVEKIKTARTPTKVLVGGHALPRVAVLRSGSWTYNPSAHVLRVARRDGRSVVVS